MDAADPVTCSALSLQQIFGGREAALFEWATLPLDDQPFGGREAACLDGLCHHQPTGHEYSAGR